MRYCSDPDCLGDAFNCVAAFDSWFSVGDNRIAYFDREEHNVTVCDRISGGNNDNDDNVVVDVSRSCLTTPFPAEDCTILSFDQRGPCSRPMFSIRSYAPRHPSDADIPQSVTFTFRKELCRDSEPVSFCLHARGPGSSSYDDSSSLSDDKENNINIDLFSFFSTKNENDDGFLSEEDGEEKKSIRHRIIRRKNYGLCREAPLTQYLGSNFSGQILWFETLPVPTFIGLPISMNWASVWGAFGVVLLACLHGVLCCVYTTVCSKWHRRKRKYLSFQGTVYGAPAKARIRLLVHMVAALVFSFRVLLWLADLGYRAVIRAEDLGYSVVLCILAFVELLCGLLGTLLLGPIPQKCCVACCGGKIPRWLWIVVFLLFLGSWVCYVVEVSLTFGQIELLLFFHASRLKMAEFALLLAPFCVMVLNLIVFSILDCIVQGNVKFRFPVGVRDSLVPNYSIVDEDDSQEPLLVRNDGSVAGHRSPGDDLGEEFSSSVGSGEETHNLNSSQQSHQATERGCLHSFVRPYEERAFEEFDFEGIQDHILNADQLKLELKRLLNFVWKGDHESMEMAADVIDGIIAKRSQLLIPTQQQQVVQRRREQAAMMERSDGEAEQEDAISMDEVVVMRGERSAPPGIGVSEAVADLIGVEFFLPNAGGISDEEMLHLGRLLESQSAFCSGWFDYRNPTRAFMDFLSHFEHWLLSLRLKIQRDLGYVYTSTKWIDESKAITRCGSIWHSEQELYCGGLYYGMRFGFGVEGEVLGWLDDSDEDVDVYLKRREDPTAVRSGLYRSFSLPYRMGVYRFDNLHGLSVLCDENERNQEIFVSELRRPAKRNIPLFSFSKGGKASFECFVGDPHTEIVDGLEGVIYKVRAASFRENPPPDLGFRSWDDVVLKKFKSRPMIEIKKIPIHRNLVKIYATVEEESVGIAGLICERLEETVAQYVDSFARQPDAFGSQYIDDPLIDLHEQFQRMKFRIIRQSAEGLAALHASFIVHGDLKWDNVMLTSDRETVKLIDYRLAPMTCFTGVARYEVPSRAGNWEVFLVTMQRDVNQFGKMVVSLLRGEPLMRGFQSRAIHELLYYEPEFKARGLLWLRDLLSEMLEEPPREDHLKIHSSMTCITMREVVEKMREKRFGESVTEDLASVLTMATMSQSEDDKIHLGFDMSLSVEGSINTDEE